MLLIDTRIQLSVISLRSYADAGQSFRSRLLANAANSMRTTDDGSSRRVLTVKCAPRAVVQTGLDNLNGRKSNYSHPSSVRCKLLGQSVPPSTWDPSEFSLIILDHLPVNWISAASVSLRASVVYWQDVPQVGSWWVAWVKCYSGSSLGRPGRRLPIVASGRSSPGRLGSARPGRERRRAAAHLVDLARFGLAGSGAGPQLTGRPGSARPGRKRRRAAAHLVDLARSAWPGAAPGRSSPGRLGSARAGRERRRAAAHLVDLARLDLAEAASGRSSPGRLGSARPGRERRRAQLTW
ncbi:hypothetical protein ACJJTC_014775 [Scirpophaga incertulas]